MLRTAKPCAPRTRKPQLYGEILRDLLETLFDCSSPVACGAFSSETSLFLFTEAVVTLAGFFFVCLFVFVVVVFCVFVVFFFRSHHFALSPRSERLEQASVTPVGDRS